MSGVCRAPFVCQLSIVAGLVPAMIVVFQQPSG